VGCYFSSGKKDGYLVPNNSQKASGAQTTIILKALQCNAFKIIVVYWRGEAALINIILIKPIMLLPPNKGRRLQRVTLKADQVAIALQVDQAIALLPEQSNYLGNVLRLETGSKFIALDRSGGWWLAQLIDHGRAAKIIGKLENNSELIAPITLGIAMPKGNHIEDVIRQTTELGIEQIMPLFSDRTIIKSGTEIGNQKRDRWQRIAEEAAELSMRTHIPKVHTPKTLETWLNIFGEAVPQQQKSIGFIAVTKPDAPHLLTCLQKYLKSEILPIAIATGCEGGWTEREEAMAIAAGFMPVSLGDRVLSAVTAPVVALSIVGAYLDTHEYESNPNSVASFPDAATDHRPQDEW